MPGIRKEPLWFHLLNLRFEFHMLITRIGSLSTRSLAGNKRSLEIYSKPLTKLPIVSQSAPHPRNRGLEFNPLVDSIFHDAQPPRCILTAKPIKRNHSVAYCFRPNRIRIKA